MGRSRCCHIESGFTYLLWQMLLFPNALCCSLCERNCVCAVTQFFTKFLPANNFCQPLWVTRKLSCTFAGNAQAQLHFRDDQHRAFGISNISNYSVTRIRDNLSNHPYSDVTLKVFIPLKANPENVIPLKANPENVILKYVGAISQLQKVNILVYDFSKYVACFVNTLV